MSKEGFKFTSTKINPSLKIVIVASKWNADLVNPMVQSASKHLKELGFKNLTVNYVPGAWELVHASQKAIQEADGVISFGVLIRGETTHYELISESVAQGLMKVSIETKKPLAFGLIATENQAQAEQRTNPKQLDKGKEIAQSLVEMLS
jgi:6,7-dimethyl-8-ribityllumazine synthase